MRTKNKKVEAPASPPTSVRIAGFDWSVTYHNDTTSCEGLQGNLGMCRRHAKTIDVASTPGLHPDEVRDTTLHEILHAVFYTFNLGGDDDEEEKIVRPLATALIGVFKDNPQLLAFLSDK